MIQVSELHRQAGDRLQNVSGNPKKLALIHAAIALGSSFLVSLAALLCNYLIADTSGLDGMGMRAILSTAQSALEVVLMLALPLWQMGIFYAALRWTSRETASVADLAQGFRRVRSVLGVLLLQGGLFLALSLPISYIGTAVFLLSPFSVPFMELLAPYMEQGAISNEVLEAMATTETAEAFAYAAIPLLVICGILYAIVAIPMFYRTRFSNFAVMDGLPAFSAFLKSFSITKKNSLGIFFLDLRFWWFYVLQLLTVAMCYADVLLPLVGVTMPFSPVVNSLIAYCIGSVCQCLLLWQFEAHRVTVYGLAYCALDGTLNADSGEEAI